ncbi:LamG-like jellyroll fold domain-containing protein, partial [Polaromonas sp.]|uniref:LamG-like jellyroll fold domain-containing protein n=1 Tax=Polaromonas sp. TaxID=1869339 RepID=UPI0032639F49
MRRVIAIFFLGFVFSSAANAGFPMIPAHQGVYASNGPCSTDLATSCQALGLFNGVPHMLLKDSVNYDVLVPQPYLTTPQSIICGSSHQGNYLYNSGYCTIPASCPAHSAQSGTSCVCNAGYAENAAQNGCVPGGVGVTVVDIFRSTKASSCPWCEGNPIYPLVGGKVEAVTTGMSVGGQPLVFTYDSAKQSAALAAGKTAKTFGNMPALGGLWESSLHRNLALGTGDIGATLYRGNGHTVSFRSSGGTYVADADVTGRFTAISGGYRYIDAKSRSIETYNTAGRLISWADIAGNALSFSYSSDAGPGAPAAGYLQTVTDNIGRSLSFAYSLPAGGAAATDGVISSVSDSMGRTVGVGFDPNGNLTHLTWQDAKVRQFVYEDTSLPWALTGVVDERGIRYSTFTYDTAGRALSTEHAGGVEKFSVSYGTPPQATMTQTYDPVTALTTRIHGWQAPSGVQITRPSGEVANASSSTVLGYPLPTGFSQPAGSGYGASNNASTFDASGNLTSTDDFSGQRSCYAYDSGNRETVRVEGLASTINCATVLPITATLPSGARKITTTWHPDWRLPVASAAPGTLTTLVYQGQPDPLNGNTTASCTSAAAMPNGKPLPVVCKRIVQLVNPAVAEPVQGDHYAQSNSLLLHADGVNGATAFVDDGVAMKTLSVTGSASVSTASKVFGTGSAAFANGGYISVPSTTDFNFGASPFTIEFFLKPNSIGGIQGLVSTRTSAVYSPFEIDLQGSSVRILKSNAAVNSWEIVGVFPSTAIAANAWQHVAIVGNGTVMSVYVNGVPSTSTAAYTPFAALTGPLYIGKGGDGAFSGSMDEIRISKGVARYSAAFTMPAAQFANAVGYLPATGPDASFTYDAAGRMLTAKDALNRTTTYAYYTATAFTGTAPSETGHTTGDLQSVTNAAGHVTQYTQFDRAGRVRQMIDPKGVVTD